jgi:DNA-binding GntR family transcriptional regulator
MTADADRAARLATQAASQAARQVPPYEIIKQAIIKGELLPGQPLVEGVLAATCQVSRTPIREALTRLEQDGLVERSDRGLIVRDRSPEEILDIYQVRGVLEGTVATSAADRRNEHDIRILRSLLKQSDQVKADDDEAKVEVNRAFHHAVWAAGHNDCLLDLLERLDLHLGRYPATTLSFPGRWDEARHEHGELVDAIESRDGAAAQACALRHFSRARDIRLDLWYQADARPRGGQSRR